MASPLKYAMEPRAIKNATNEVHMNAFLQIKAELCWKHTSIFFFRSQARVELAKILKITIT